MSAAEVESSFKVVVKGGDTKLTKARLQDALNTLHAKGVPEWADLEVNRQPGRDAKGWAVVAKWDPDQAPTPPPPEFHIEVAPGSPLDPERIREIQRRIQDNPQA